MICKKCGNEIPDNSLFCNFCGDKIEKNLELKLEDEEKEDMDIKEPKEFSKHEYKKNKNKLMMGIISVILIVAIAAIYGISSNKTNTFLDALDDKNYDEAREVYNKEIRGDIEEEKKLTEKLEMKVDNIVGDFKANQISYDDAIKTLDEISNLGLLKNKTREAKRDISDIAESRAYFKRASEFEKSGDYINALEEYNNVIEIDTENYSNAQVKIEELSEVYKKEVLTKIEEFAENNDYKSAISLIDDALNIFPNDSNLVTKKRTYNELLQEQIAIEKAQEKEKAKNEQLITVESTRILIQSTEYKALYPDLYEVVIKNNSGKTIKSYKVSMLGWDKNGYPLKIKQNFLDDIGSYEFLGYADNVNVIDGATFGKNSGWSLEEGHNIAITKAVVIEAEFYDGTVWDNPYYKYFLDEFEGKPLEN